MLETAGAALERGAPAQVQLLQHPGERRPSSQRFCDFGGDFKVPKRKKKKKPPAAVDELHQTSIGQVPAAPQVQRAEEPGASGQHAGHHVVVFNLQQSSSSFNTLRRLLTTKELLKKLQSSCASLTTLLRKFLEMLK